VRHLHVDISEHARRHYSISHSSTFLRMTVYVWVSKFNILLYGVSGDQSLFVLHLNEKKKTRNTELFFL